MYTDVIQFMMMNFGPSVLALGLFLGPLGFPIPTALMVSAVGAFTRNGMMDIRTAIGLSLLVTVIGDTASYALGRYSNAWLKRLVDNRNGIAWQKAHEMFRGHGGFSIFISRFLLAVLDVPVNILAGSSSYAFQRFIVWDVAGRVVWILIYGGLGYFFSSQWQTVSRIVSISGVWLAGAMVICFGVFLLLRRLLDPSSKQISARY